MKHFVIFFLGFSSLFFTFLTADTVQSESYHFYFDAPVSWNVVEGTDKRTFLLSDPNGESTVSVEAFFHDDYQALSILKQARVSAYYDGWMIKFERLGNASEKKAANVKDMAIVAYSHYEPGSTGTMQEVIVGEYYFVTGNYSYVISAKTTTAAWKSVQGPLKRIVTSFSSGHYVPPIIDEPLESYSYTYGWECQGGRPDNSSYSESQLDPATILQAFWSKEVLKNQVFSSLNYPVVYGERVFIYDGSALHAYQANDGNEEWNTPLKGRLSCPLVVSNGVVYFSREETPTMHVVTAVSGESGLVLYSLSFAQPIIALRVAYGVLTVSNSFGLTLFDAVTGHMIQKKALAIKDESYPVVSTQSVLVYTPSGLTCLNRKSLEKMWVYSREGHYPFPPLVSKTKVIFIYQSNDLMCTVTALAPLTGERAWQAEFPAIKQILSVPCLVQSRYFFVGLDADGNRFLYALSCASGELLWKVPVKAKSDLHYYGVLGFSDYVLCNGGDGLVSYSALTGESQPLRFLSKSKSKEPLSFFCTDGSSLYKCIDKGGKLFIECNR